MKINRRSAPSDTDYLDLPHPQASSDGTLLLVGDPEPVLDEIAREWATAGEGSP